MQTEHQLIFDRYQLDLANEQLWSGGQEILLPGKAFALLRYLVEHAGQLVSKAEFFTALWPGTAVTDGALTFCLVELRKALGDNARAPRFIETVHRRGYRFLPTVATQSVQGSRFQVSSSDTQDSALRAQHAILVGREPELVHLHAWFAKALSGERQIVFITGEPGIGKTTLIEAFRQRLEAGDWRLDPSPQAPSLKSPASPVSFAHGQCIEQYGPGEPYMPILEALGRLGREPDGDRLIAVLRQQAPTWLVQMPALLPATEREVLQRQTQGATRERMLREMGEAIEAITAERPLVLWLEDLHWSDASTLELLALLARRRDPARVLVIGTYRPIEVIVQEHPLRAVKQELQLHGLCAELPLGLLSEAQVAEYLEQRFNVGATSRPTLQSVAKTLHRRTDGNPLFMVTAVEDLIAQKVLVQQAGHWAVHAELAAIETRVPDNLPQLIERQIERLSAVDRRMLEVASVAGLEFSAASVAAGLAMEVESVEARCEGLAQYGHFLRASDTAEWPDGTVTARYSFLHALYQEVLYALIPAGRRKRLHQQIGEREEAAYGKRAREIAAALAVHFEQGHDYRKAVEYLQQAGENAVLRSAHQEAINLLTKGLELLKPLPDSLERAQHEVNLQLALGNALNIAKGYTAPEVGQAYARARELCGRMEGNPQVLFALAGLFGFHLLRAELETAEELATELLRFAQSVQVPALLVGAYQALGGTSLWRGQFTTARTHLEQGIAFYSSEQRDPRGILHPGVVSFCYAGVALWSLGYPDQALARCYEGLALAHEIAQPFSLAFAVQWTASLHLYRGEIPQAQEQVNRLITLSADWAFPFWETVGTLLKGQLQVMEGRMAEGIHQLRQSIATHQAMGVAILYPASLATLAEAYGQAGRPEEGLQILPEALTVMNTTGQRHWEAELYRTKGELTLQQANQKSKDKKQRGARGWGLGIGSSSPQAPSLKSLVPSGVAQEAEEYFLKAIEVAQKQQAKSLELRATMSLARLWQRQGKQHEAHTMLSEIYNWFTEGFNTADLKEAQALLAELS